MGKTPSAQAGAQAPAQAQPVFDGGSAVDGSLEKLLALLRANKVVDFEGLGVKVSFAPSAFAAERPAKADEPVDPKVKSVVDQLKKRLGQVDPALAALVAS